MPHPDSHPPRQFRLRLQSGEFVRVVMDAEHAIDDEEFHLARAGLAELLASDRPSESELLTYLANLGHIAFPSADPAQPFVLQKARRGAFFDLSFGIRGETRIGAVLVKHPNVTPNRQAFRENLQSFSTLADTIAEANIVVGRGETPPIPMDVVFGLPISVHILTWDKLVERITLVPKDLEEAPEHTLYLTITIRKCRELLAGIAKRFDMCLAINSREFEEVVARLLFDLGFQDVELTPPSKDGGRDIIATYLNQLTGCREIYLFECKHWVAGDKVRLKVVTRLKEVVKGDKASGGVIVAWGGFSPIVLEQEAHLRKEGIHLKDRKHLAAWVSLWERCYGSVLTVPVDPVQLLEIEKG